MVYSKFTYKIIKRGGGKTVIDGTDIFLADSNGKCSIWIGSGGIGDYRQIGVKARVAFADNDSIKVLKFDVLASADVDSNPDSISAVTSSTVYVGPATAYGVNDIELSKDGNAIYFTDEYSPTGGGWQNTLKSIDIGECDSNCTPAVRYVFPLNVGVGGLSINDAGDRIYMSIHDRLPDIRTISFLQKDVSGTWGSLRHVVSDQDGGYDDGIVTGFAGTALGQWEYNVGSGLRDVLAFVVERDSGDTTDIIDVTDCVGIPEQSCLSSTSPVLVLSGIAGHAASFTSIPAPSGSSPNLLVLNGGVTEVDLSSNPLVTRQVLEGGFGANSAD